MAKNRRRCFLDMSIDGRDAGRIVFELFDDLAPKTTENFLQLCTGQAGTGKKGVPLSYRGSTFHRIIKDFMIQGGDFTDGNGTGGESIYGSMFEDEPFIAKHDQPYLLSMANKGPNTNGSQFFVTMRPTPHLDGKHCVFGKVVSGTEVVSEIEHLKVDGKSRPIADVIIINCGELVRKRQIDPSESEDEKDKKKKKRRHSNSEEEEKENGKEEVQVSTVKAEDLPAEPANQHSFLMRRSKTPEDRKKQRTSERQRNRSRDRSGDRRRSDHRDSRHRGRSNSPWRRRSRERNTRDSGRTRNERIEKTTGVKTKGRGFLRFNRTDRSQTPPHWRREVNRLKTLDDLHTERERLGGSDAVVKPMRGTHADANEDAAASDKPKDVKVESGQSPRRIPEDNSDAEAVDLGHSGDESDNDDALDEAREQAQALKELHNREHEDEKSTEIENQEEERKEREASVAASEKEKSETPEKAKSKSRSRSRSHSRRRSRSRSRSRHNSRSRERKRSPEKRRSPERRRSGDTRREKRRSRSRDRDHHSSSRRDSRRSRSRDNRRRRSPPRSDRRRRRSRSSS